MNSICSAEFAGSHMCIFTEYLRAAPRQSPPVSGAWVQTAGIVTANSGGYGYASTTGALAEAGAYLDNGDCFHWTGSGLGQTGLVVLPGPFQNNATPPFSGVDCTQSHSVACCK